MPPQNNLPEDTLVRQMRRASDEDAEYRECLDALLALKKPREKLYRRAHYRFGPEGEWWLVV